VVKKLILLFLCLDALVLSVIYVQEFCAFMYPPQSGDNTVATELQGGPTTIQLSHRPLTVFQFPAMKAPLAVILFASGDGGWIEWEESVSRNLQANGYTVIGIDSSDYAKTDYDEAMLQADFSTIARATMAAYKSPPPPLIVGGWSMGAAQAIAVGGGPNRPPSLVGLLLVSPSSRGRFGLRVSDRVDILPTGPGTFSVEDFIPGLNGLRIAQWHAGGDTVDSTAWLSDLKTDHREYDYPNVGHDYAYPNPSFLNQMVESVAWILNPSSSQK